MVRKMRLQDILRVVTTVDLLRHINFDALLHGVNAAGLSAFN